MTEPLRIAIFSESYLPYLSGVTVSTEALARGLGTLGHRVLLVAPQPADGGLPPPAAGAPGPDPAYAWLPSYQGPPPAPPAYRMPYPWPSAALRQARAFAPHVVHAQSPFASGLMARRLARRRRVPLVFTHHTRFSDYRHYLGALGRPVGGVLDAYLRDFWAGCAAVVAPGSDLAAEMVAGLGGRTRPVVRTIPTGVDVAGIAALAPDGVRTRFGWPADAIVAVSVGRLAPEKSVDLLLDAFTAAAATEPRLRLLLVGGGPSEATLRERAADPALGGGVAITGRLPRTEALSMARGGDIFVFASQTETQGLVIAEALAAGLPVVAVDAPGVRDAVRHGIDGLLVDALPAPGRGQRLAAALRDVAADAARREALAAAATEGAGRFDLAARVSEVADLYRELLVRRRHTA